MYTHSELHCCIASNDAVMFNGGLRAVKQMANLRTSDRQRQPLCRNQYRHEKPYVYADVAYTSLSLFLGSGWCSPLHEDPGSPHSYYVGYSQICQENGTQFKNPRQI